MRLSSRKNSTDLHERTSLFITLFNVAYFLCSVQILKSYKTYSYTALAYWLTEPRLDQVTLNSNSSRFDLLREVDLIADSKHVSLLAYTENP
jgi:hypothetical protein